MFINKQKRLKDLDMKIVYVFPQCIYSKYYAYNFTVFALAYDSSSLLSSFKRLKPFNFLVNLALALQCSISVHYDIKRNENFFILIRLFNPNLKFTQIWFFFCKTFAWIYFRGEKKFKNFAKTNFRRLAKIPRNLWKLIHVKINLAKINLVKV